MVCVRVVVLATVVAFICIGARALEEKDLKALYEDKEVTFNWDKKSKDAALESGEFHYLFGASLFFLSLFFLLLLFLKKKELKVMSSQIYLIT